MKGPHVRGLSLEPKFEGDHAKLPKEKAAFTSFWPSPTVGVAEAAVAASAAALMRVSMSFSRSSFDMVMDGEVGASTT